MGFLLSAFTETVQLFFKLGLCEVDDLISNTLGTLVGVGLYKGYKRLAGCRVGGSQYKKELAIEIKSG